MNLSRNPSDFTILDELTTALKPIKPSLTPHLPDGNTPEALLFDIYGTLLISSSGDIGSASALGEDDAFIQTLSTFYETIPQKNFKRDFFKIIHNHHQNSRRKGQTSPEVDIREIWAQGLKLWELPADTEIIPKIALFFECLTNKVWPMPGAKELLQAIKIRGIPMGIVSNAQFYTPLLLEYFFEENLSSLGFGKDLVSWSYLNGQSKPSKTIFRKPLETLQAMGISREGIYYVGNDMLNDVWTAKEWGLKALLFAGDERSLRLREDNIKCRDLKPEGLVTELRQITKWIGTI